MTDLSDLILPRLKAGQISGLELKGDFVFPDYAGGSLLNVAGTICDLFGAPPLGAMPLRPEYLGDLGADIQRVIVLVVDGLGWQRFRGMLERGNLLWSRFAEQGRISPLTSVVPSTTSAALTSLWTGASPVEHGILGYELWLKEFGVVANMIVHSVMSAANDPGGLQRLGFHPDTFLGVPRLGPHLQRYGVNPYCFMPFPLARSGLTSMHLPGVGMIPYRSPVDLSRNLAEFFESHALERLYACVYWEELDTLAHLYGPDDPRIDAEFQLFSQAIEHLFLEQVNPKFLQNTLLILTADHGLVHTDHKRDFELRSHPELGKMLHIYPTGENRLAFLYVRPGMTEAACCYIQHTWPNQFEVVSSMEALQSGIFGPAAKASPHSLSRLGDLICVARDTNYLWWSQKDNRMVGRHGGLSPAEMLVPLLAVRL